MTRAVIGLVVAAAVYAAYRNAGLPPGTSPLSAQRTAAGSGQQVRLDPDVLLPLMDGTLPATRTLALDVPGGRAVSLRLDPLSACGSLGGQLAFSGRASDDEQDWYVRLVAGAGDVRALLVGNQTAWSYSVADAAAGLLNARQLNTPGGCAVTSEDQVRDEVLRFAPQSAATRSWPASPRMLRFAIAATYDFQHRFPDAVAVARRNLLMASAIFERFANITLCPVIVEAAIEDAPDTLYPGTKRQRRELAHRRFYELELDFDLGQVFDIAGDSSVEVGGVCDPGRKGAGITNWPATPAADTSDLSENVWTLAHEIGHQLGGRHTFNASFNGREPGSAVEPESGTSLLAYPTERTRHWFHPFTIRQLLGYVGGVTRQHRTCGVSLGPTAKSAPALRDQRFEAVVGSPFSLTIEDAGTTFAVGEITPAVEKGNPPWMQPQPPSGNRTFTFPATGDSMPPAGSVVEFLVMAQDAKGSIGFARQTVTLKQEEPVGVPRPRRQ